MHYGNYYTITKHYFVKSPNYQLIAVNYNTLPKLSIHYYKMVMEVMVLITGNYFHY